MADPQTHDNLAKNPVLSHSHSTYPADPDPGNDPPLSVSPAVAASGDLSNEDPDLTQEPKRRRLCPTALENLDELTTASNSSFTFTFDTKFCGFAAEVSPKFGSFNSIVPEIEKKQDQSSHNSASAMGEKEETVLREEEDEEESEVVVGGALREAVGGLESVMD